MRYENKVLPATAIELPQRRLRRGIFLGFKNIFRGIFFLVQSSMTLNQKVYPFRLDILDFKKYHPGRGKIFSLSFH